MANKINSIVMIAVSLMVVAIIMPIALGLLGGAGDTAVSINGTSTLVSTLVDPNVLTMLTVLLPIIAVVGIAIKYIPRK